MGRFLRKNLGNLKRAWERLSYLGRGKGTLVYVGANRGHGLNRIAHRYARVFAFEPDPVAFEQLRRRFRFRSGITLVNAACGKTAGESTLFVSNNHGIASSLSPLRPDNLWRDVSGLSVASERKVTIINLADFLAEAGVGQIAMYISDIQEHDLDVLETIQPYLDAGRIDQIQIELTYSKQSSQYLDAPDNSLAKAEALLGGRYEMIASGMGELVENQTIHLENHENFDTLWRLKP